MSIKLSRCIDSCITIWVTDVNVYYSKKIHDGFVTIEEHTCYASSG